MRRIITPEEMVLNKERAVSLGFIKKMGLLVLFAFIAVLVCFIYLQSRSGKREYEDKQIINIFGKQRMYTQMIAKDSSSLFVLLQDLEDISIIYPDRAIQDKLQEYKNNLSKAEYEFSLTLNSLKDGHLRVKDYDIDIRDSIGEAAPYLESINANWEKFDEAIRTMVRATRINNETLNAAIYINSNNLELLNLCDQIQQVVLAASIESTRNTKYIIYGLIGLLSIISIVSLSLLMKYIILPFNRLYRGISEIGLDQYPTKGNYPTSKKVMPIIDEISSMFLKINHLITLIEDMNKNYSSFTESLDFINRTFSQFIPYNYIGIALFDDDKKLLRASYGVSDGTILGMPDRVVGQSWPIHDTSMEQLLQTGEARIINDLERYTEGKPMKPYNRIILDAGIRASITLPLQVAGAPVGVIFFSSSQKNVYREEHLNFLKTLVNSIAISFNQNIFINDLIFSSILALAKLAEARDEDTGEHLDRMKMYSRLITELLYENNVYPGEITLEYLDRIERFSPLHDIGKVGIRDGILLKPAKLTEEEYNEMKRHTLYGAEVLRAAEENISRRGRSLFGIGIEIAEGHHEKWDGSGYPHGKKGLEIPLSARIVAVADVFDALTSKRPYKKAFSFDISMNIIEEGKGKHFDPRITDMVLANKDRMEQLYKEFQRIS
jgi:HD-GYP domain-containing protein (c-di-GMP phosphodiesterase class II)